MSCVPRVGSVGGVVARLAPPTDEELAQVILGCDRTDEVMLTMACNAYIKAKVAFDLWEGVRLGALRVHWRQDQEEWGFSGEQNT